MTLSFADFGLRWFEDIIGRMIMWFTRTLTDGYDALSRGTLSTPTPAGHGVDLVFSKPASSDAPWHSIYEATVTGEMMFFGLIVLFLCVQGRHFVRIFDIGSAHEHRRTRRSALTGGFVIVSWYWVATLTLYVVEALTIGLLPNVARTGAALASLLPEAVGTPLITLLMTGIGAVSIVFLRALFVIRELLLYVFLYTMPIGLGVMYGNVPIVSEIARRFAVQFLALAVLPLPAALLLRGYALLFTGSNPIPLGGPFAAYLVAISMPTIALYVTWKTFGYAAPLASRAIRGVGRGAALAGTVGTAAYVAGPQAAAIATRWGAKGAAGAMLSQRGGVQNGSDRGQPSEQQQRDAPDGGVPAYRRSENDPTYY